MSNVSLINGHEDGCDICVRCGEYITEKGKKLCNMCDSRLQDSGQRRHFDTGAVRDISEGKGRCDLLPACTDKEIIKAKEHFEYGIKSDIFSEPVTSYAKTAVEALEKQIPKKPYIDKRGCVDTYCCQNCKESLYEVNMFKEYFALREMVYCDNCGQAVDWSDTDDR